MISYFLSTDILRTDMGNITISHFGMYEPDYLKGELLINKSDHPPPQLGKKCGKLQNRVTLLFCIQSNSTHILFTMYIENMSNV